MTNKEIKKLIPNQIKFDFFEDYNNKVEIVGFKTSWVSEFEEDMKNAYEDKPKRKKS